MTRVLAVLVLALSLQLHAVPAAANLPVSASPASPKTGESSARSCTVRPEVRAVASTIRVDNRANTRRALVVVWRPYENSSETFWAAAGRVTVEPTLHYGRIRVWVVFSHSDPAVSFLYRKRMR